MKSSVKNVLLLLGALTAGFLLQFVAAFAVMIPAVVVKQMQIISMGLSGTPQETEMLNQVVTDVMGPTVLVTHVFLLICFALWYGFGCCRKRNAVITFKNTFRSRNILIIAVIAVGCCYLTNFIMPVAGMFIPENIMQSYLDLIEAAGFGESILPTIAAVLIAPFGEELIFRGVIYHYACNLVGTMPGRRKAFYIANTIQALAFGIFHGNLIQGTYAFLLGLALGYLRERFGSIWASILAHMLINGCSTFLWEPIAMRLPESVGVFTAGAVICAAIVLVGFKLGGPALEKTNFEEEKGFGTDYSR